MSEEYTGEERRQHCSPESRCSDMIKVIVWGKATRFFLGGGVLLLVLSSFVGTASQLKSTGQISVMNSKIEDLSVAIGALRDTVQILNERLEFVQHKQNLQDYDMSMTRHHMNQALKRLGVTDFIDTRPFDPPDLYEVAEFANRLKEKKSRKENNK